MVAFSSFARLPRLRSSSLMRPLSRAAPSRRRCGGCETPPVADRTPTVVEVLAEHTDAFLWNRTPDRHPDDAFVVDPALLGMSPELIALLEAWNVGWSRRALGLETSEDSAETWERT